jgi:hypothetical protein
MNQRLPSDEVINIYFTMSADDQAEGVLERNRLSAIAKIKQDLAWRSVAGVPMSQIVITRQQRPSTTPWT